MSSTGTASPDLFQVQSSILREEIKPIKIFPIVRDIFEKEEDKMPASPSKKGPPPAVAPKPQSKKQTRLSYVESAPSEDSGIIQDDRIRIGSDSSKSEANETAVPPQTVTVRRTSETAFVAVATPVRNDFNFSESSDRGRLSSASSDHFEADHSGDHSEEEDSFNLGRNVARKSMFVDNPLLDRWAELQEQRMFGVRRKVDFFSKSFSLLFFLLFFSSVSTAKYP